MEHNQQIDPLDSKISTIRMIVRGTYDLQDLRIQSGNRITGNYKTKLGYKTDGMTEAQLDKQSQKILSLLRLDYIRITDGIVAEGNELIINKLPSEKSFKSGQIIDSFVELVLVDGYMRNLDNEIQGFKNLEKVLKGIPIYDQFLSKVDGVGKQMAGVIISEIDIHKTEYASSLWKFAGLDTVRVGVYTDENGKEHFIPGYEIDEMLALEDDEGALPLYKGRYKIQLKWVGRSKHAHCLVKRKYKNKKGEENERLSITFNPFLKTKLVGVLGSSFLRQMKVFVDGVKTSKADVEKMALKMGFQPDVDSPMDVRYQMIDFLRGHDYDVSIERSPYAQIYENYKRRIRVMPAHKDKSDKHTHNMAIRYCVKRFLVDLYSAWRQLAGLPVMPEYAVAKLGLEHGVATPAKQTFYENRGWKPQDQLQGNIGV